MILNRSNIMAGMPAPAKIITIDYKNANNGNIIEVIHKNIARAILETKSISNNFKGSTPEDTGRNIWNFLKNELTYIKDGKNQDVKTPSALIKIGSGDCKSFSLFTLGILYNLGYSPILRYVSYDSDPTPSHVYTYFIANGRKIIIDGVFNKFNSEQKYTHKKDRIMQVRSINGVQQPRNNFFIGCPDPQGVEGLKDFRRKFKQGFKNTVSKVKDVAKDVAQGAKTVVISAPRNAFLLLVQANFLGFASNLYQKSRAEIHRVWEKLGGQKDIIDNAIEKGARRKPILNKDADIRANINGIGAVAESGAALMAVATPIIIAFGALLKAVENKTNAQTEAIKTNATGGNELFVMDGQNTFGNEVVTSPAGANNETLNKIKAVVDQVTNTVKTAASNTPTFNQGQNLIPSFNQGQNFTPLYNQGQPQTPQPNNVNNMPNWLIPAAAVGALFLLMKK